MPRRRAEPLLLAWCFALLGSGVVPALAGPTRPQIDSDYWQLSIPCAIAGVGILGWMFERMLFGRNFWLRGSPTDLTIDGFQSWVVGVLAAIPLMMIAPIDAAYVVNDVFGVSYTALYTATDKYMIYGHGPHQGICYGIAVVNNADPSDEFRMCVSQAERDETVIGDKMKVKGRRSRYINQMLSYDWLS